MYLSVVVDAVVDCAVVVVDAVVDEVEVVVGFVVDGAAVDEIAFKSNVVNCVSDDG